MAYLLLPGASGDTASVPDSAALDITGDLEIITKVAADDWTPAALQHLTSKWGSVGSGGYEMTLVNNGTLRLLVDNGTTNTNFVSTVATGLTDGSAGWVRVALDVDDGGGNADATFYTSTDSTDDYTAVSWTQLGAVVSQASLSIGANTRTLYIGTRSSTGNPFAGKVYRVVINDGIAGTLAFDADPSDTSTWDCPDKLFFTDKANSATVTLQGDASLVGSCPSPTPPSSNRMGGDRAIRKPPR